MAEQRTYAEQQESAQAAAPGRASSLIRGDVGLEAAVKISPRAEVGPVVVRSDSGPSLGALPESAGASSGCELMVHQVFTIEFPLRISAEAEVALTKTACEVPLLGRFLAQEAGAKGD